MKIALIGYGKMGHAVETVALKRGHSVVSIDPAKGTFKSISAESLLGVDVAIDFSSPETAVENISAVAGLGTALVVGTTGWYAQMDQVESGVGAVHGRVLWSANFSVGMNLFMKIAQDAARKFSAFADYTVSGVEIHHIHKKDAPSGTALELSRIVDREYAARADANGLTKTAAQKLNFSSERVGEVPGTHTLKFDSAVDTIEFTHQAKSRDGFAWGAVMAAEWLSQQKPGFYNFEQCFEGWIK